MKFKIKKLFLSAGKPLVFLNEIDAEKLNLHFGERVLIKSKKKKLICLFNTLNTLKTGIVAFSQEAAELLNTKSTKEIDLSVLPEPKSLLYIIKKLKGSKLSKEELFSIIDDISNNVLDEAEIAYFVAGVYENGMSLKETIYLTEAMSKTGFNLKWNSQKIADKHCIGGIAGNRTTPIVVSICAASGIIMPKTSSRAISSASGTADVIETITNVSLSVDQLKKVVKKTNACLAWGGALGMAPSDDKLIRVEKLLKIDPESQLIASIMSKKLAAGSTHVLIDIPYGENAKVNLKRARKLKRKFLKVAKYFNLKLKVILTKGNEPIGNGIGPVLEIKDVFKVLKRENPPKDLEEKSIFLSGKIMEMVGFAKKGTGEKKALEVLNSGRALDKFYQIINSQGKKKQNFKLAKYSKDILSKKNGKISSINNQDINNLARKLGCPLNIGSGIYLYKHVSDNVSKGEKVLTLYSESKIKLKDVIESISKRPPFLIHND